MKKRELQSRRKRLNADERATVVRDWECSGRSVEEFCTIHGIGRSTLSRWRREFSTDAAPADPGTHHFVEVTVPSRNRHGVGAGKGAGRLMLSASESPSVSIRLASGVTIDIFDAGIEHLGAVVSALGGQL